jgi:class 3 adenylate cyclase
VTESPSVDGAVVFTDLVGFTEFTDALGDAAAVDLIERQLAVVGEAIGAAGEGRIVKEIGDGLMLWFPSATVALEAARSIRDGLCRARGEGFPLAIRIGVHAGKAVQRGDDLVGHMVNVASRIADAAGPDEVLVSEDVLRAASLSGDRSTSQPIGAVYVKGIAAPVWLARLSHPLRETSIHGDDQDPTDG